MRNYLFIITALLGLGTVPLLAQESGHHHQHGGMPLTEAGNDAFGTIQEVVMKLNSNPDTDWSKVDLEALRQHLIDMENFTVHVAVLNNEDIEKGARFTVQATSKDAYGSLKRMFDAHPAMVKQEAGWDMQVAENRDKSFTVMVTTDKPKEVAKIRGLGYIGIIAYGQHHQQHHWMMATGMHAHGH